MRRLMLLLFLAAVAGACASTRARTPPAENAPERTRRPERPVFFAIEPPPEYQAAVERGTRAADGAPGPRYWQQWAEYDLTARLLPGARRLEGEARIRYHNNSPDTLAALHVNLLQNFHAPNAIRSAFAPVTGGMRLDRVEVQGVVLDSTPAGDDDGAPGYEVTGTVLRIAPPDPVPPGSTVELGFAFGFDIPQAGSDGRMGYSRDNLFFIAYWYPQMAVYDDVVGWHTDQFTGNAEFYAGFADYDVTIEAADGWLVRATGELTNPEETLAPAVLERLRTAARSDSIVHVVTAADLDRQTQSGAPLAWHFQADSVHDFSFSATRESLLDATRTPVGDRDGDGATDYARVEALYRETAPLWREAARYGAFSIRELGELTATPYPWPHMTAVEGADIVDGGMEFPMMTLIGDYNARGDSALMSVIAHEFGHMWIPMIVSNDERRYAWMDEGTTSYNENQVEAEFYPGVQQNLADREDYLETARARLEGPIMRWSDYHYPGPAYRDASYNKPATVLVALEGLLGEETFLHGYHALFDRWAWRHPYPWDFFRTFEDAAGRNLDWFWRSWYYETWRLDQAVAEVTAGDESTVIAIADRGFVPMPVDLAITFADGSTARREIPVDVWLDGSVRTTIMVEGDAPVTRVEIDPEGDFPDVDRSNNVWTR